MISKDWFKREDIKKEELRKAFADPSKEYRPYMFWFWKDEKPETEKYREQAEKMHEKGISCGYIQDRGFVDLMKTGDDCKWLSNVTKYFEVFDAVLEETKKAGLSLGYCEPATILRCEDFAGGDEDLAAVSLSSRVTEVRRGSTFVPGKAFFTVAARLCDDGSLDSDSLTLIDGETDFRAEDSDYRIFEFDKFNACTTEGTKANLLTEKAGRRAMELIHQRYIDRYKDDIGKTISGHFFDLEGDYGYKLCYSDELAAAYKKRTGRDFFLNCPLLLEKDAGGKWMRARYDWFDTVSELYTNFNFKYPSDRLKEYGMYYTTHLWEERLMGQALLAGDPMRVYRAITMPGIDHLGKDHTVTRSYKEAQSVCEFDSKRFMCEILGCAGWELKPSELRASINNALSLSVSNFVPHGSYSDRSDITKARYAPDFSDWQPMWNWFEDCADYITRGSYLISKGKMEAEVLLYNPIESVWALLGDGAFDSKISYENSWVYDKPRLSEDFEFGGEITEIDRNYIEAIDKLTAENVGFLIADRHYLKKMSVDDGCLCFGGYRFGAIVLPPIKILSLENAKKLLEFARSGGYIYAMGYLPEASAENGANDSEMIEIMKEIKKQNGFVGIGELTKEVGSGGLARQIEFLEGKFNIHMQKRIIDGHSFYWLSNDTDMNQKSKILFKGENGRAVLWDLERGERRPIKSKDTEEGSVIEHEFGISEGMFIEFVPEEKPFEGAERKKKGEFVLKGEWLIKYEPSKQPALKTGFEKEIPGELLLGKMSEPKDWKSLGLEDFSGCISYEKEFELSEDRESVVIDLGKVNYMAEISVDNEKPVKRLWAPYRAEFSDLKKGRHKLCVTVGNTLINMLNPHRDDGGKDFWPMCKPTKEDFESGLFGEVSILEF